MTSVKATFNNEIRRFRLEDVGKLQDVRDFLNKVYKVLPQPFDIKYKDDEGDLITITTDDELNEAARLYRLEMGNKVLRLIVTEGKMATPPAKPVASPVVSVPEKKQAPAVVEKPKEVVKIDVDTEKSCFELELELAGLNFEKLVAALQAKLALNTRPDVRYLDDENDLVTMADDKDLHEALSLSKSLKLRIGKPPAVSTDVSPLKPKVEAKRPIGPSPVNKPWKEMSWDDIDKICSALTKLGFKNHAKNTEFVAKYEGNWQKIVEALESSENQGTHNSGLFHVE